MAQSATIREYSIEDGPVLKELYLSGLDGADQKSIEKYVKRALKEFDNLGKVFTWSENVKTLWVAEDSETSKIIGMIALKKTNVEGEVELVRLSVDPRLRRQGLGKRLVQHLEEFAKARGEKRVILTTLDLLVPAIELYKSLGYHQGQSKPIAPGLGLVDMWKDFGGTENLL